MTGVEDRRFEEARHKIQWSGDVLSMRDVRVAACNGVFLDRNMRVAVIKHAESHRAYRHMGHREIFAPRDKCPLANQPRVFVRPRSIVSRCTHADIIPIQITGLSGEFA